MKKKIIVRGPALSRSGYGEQTRFALRALRENEDKYDIYISNTSWGKTGVIWDDTKEKRWLDLNLIKTQDYIQKGGAFDVSLQVTIPNEWEKLAPINIGYTAGIETTKIAPQWIEKSNMMDKIIVVSNHAKQGFDSTAYQAQDKQTGQVGVVRTTTPVEVVNYAVRDIEPKNLDLDLKTDFNYLTVAQWGPRKNLDNTIKWFVEEFMDTEVGLVVKAFAAKSCTIDKFHTRQRLNALLSKYPNRKCKVYLLHGDMTDEEMSGLYTHPKIKGLVCISHGEGYGLPMFEAAYNSLPVIAPDWSGQCDFLHKPDKKKKGRMRHAFLKVDYELKPIQKEAVWEGVLDENSMWCFPRKESYKAKLKMLNHNYGAHKKRAKELASYIRKNFDSTKIHSQFVDALNIQKDYSHKQASSPEEVFLV
jgi:hypothetical protein